MAYKHFYLSLMVAGVLIYGCSSDENRTNANEWRQATPSVEAVQAQFGSLPLEERLSGTIRAGHQVDIYPRISAVVEEVYVENGEYVEKGEPLVRLDSQEYRERLAQAEATLRINQARARQAEARLNEAQNHLRRQRVLHDRDLTSALQLEMAEADVASAEADHELALAQVDQAQASINEQQEQLNRTTVRSPLTGRVGGRNAEVGMQVNNTSRLFTVGDLSSSKVLVSLTENMLRYVEIGHTARIYSEALGDTVLYGEVSRISPFLGQNSFSTQAEIDLEGGSEVIPGMFVTVDILYGESEQATLVPLSAIYRHPRTGEEGIYVANGFGTEREPITEVDTENPPPLSDPIELEFRRIQIVAKGREAAGVVGINSGEWIVTVGQSMMVGSLDNNARVRATTWDRILSMQQSRPQDLLEQVMERDLAETVE